MIGADDDQSRWRMAWRYQWVVPVCYFGGLSSLAGSGPNRA
jgi:hypothetical protein